MPEMRDAVSGNSRCLSNLSNAQGGDTINRLAAAGLLIFLLLCGLAAGAIIQQYVTVKTDGNVKTPAGIIATPSSIHWGTFFPGQNMTGNQTILLSNTGDVQTAPLALLINWTSPTYALGTVTWNGTGAEIPPRSAGAFWVALTMTNSTPQAFTFDINIIRTG